MIKVDLVRIVVDEEKKEQVIILKEEGGIRLLPIVIGSHEASAIKMKLKGLTSPRPLTHDLLYSTILSLGVNLEKVVIDNLVDGAFHAKIYLRGDQDLYKIVDARPSDSIALAVRAKSPIFVEEHVLNKFSQSTHGSFKLF